MSVAFTWIPEGDLLSVPGWRAATTTCGVKPSGALDLALLCADRPNTAAAVWTKNAMPAAPVRLGQTTLARGGGVRAIVINSGNANAMTGARGDSDARAMQAQVEELCSGPAIVLSTGVIGVPLPLERIQAGIATCAEALSASCPELPDAILTTDTCRKTAALGIALPALEDQVTPRTATIGGVAKGSGMIHPNMATMLAVVATDQAVEAGTLERVLRRATDLSFHEISVDGDTSTNDAVLLLAGSGGGAPITDDDPRLPALEAGVTAVMQRLARAIIEDGEGASRLMELQVTGASDVDAARQVATSIVRSALVKTALAGGDPNWGRVLAAAANAGVELAGDRLSLEICGVRVFERGAVAVYDERALAERFSADEVGLVLDLGQGEASARRYTTDLTTDYVRINSEYTT